MAGGQRWTANAVARQAAGIAYTIASLLILPDAAVAAPPAAPSAKTWRPAACPPPPSADKGSSRLAVTGPCGLDFTGDAECDTEFDDMMLIARRKAKNGAELVIYINVERYVGAGHYKAPNDIYVSVKDKGTIYRWSTNDFEATIGPGSRFLSLDVTTRRLTAITFVWEPPFIGGATRSKRCCT